MAIRPAGLTGSRSWKDRFSSLPDGVAPRFASASSDIASKVAAYFASTSSTSGTRASFIANLTH